MTTQPTSAPTPPGASGTWTTALIERAKNILLTPRAEWERIAPEPVQVTRLYTHYVLPLAVLSAVCAVIGLAVFGVSGLGVTVRYSLGSALTSGVIQLVMTLVGVYVLALIIDALAPTFGSTKNIGQAHKLAAYSSTAGLLAGVFMLIPALGILGILGLYSLALLYIGLPRLMGTPEDKRLAYFGSIIVACVVLGVVAGMVMGGLRGAVGAGFGAPGLTLSGDGVRQASAESQATISLPGGGSIDVGELEKFADALSQGAAGAAGAAAAGAATAPGVAATDPASLERMLPATLPGGFTRESVSSGSAMGATQAEATYTRGESSITLSVMHLGAMGGIGAMAGAFNVQENRQDADGYSRTRTTDGRVYNESVSRSSNSASYGVMGKGVALSADGYGVTIEEVRAAADAIGIARLEQSAPR